MSSSQAQAWSELTNWLAHDGSLFRMFNSFHPTWDSMGRQSQFSNIFRGCSVPFPAVATHFAHFCSRMLREQTMNGVWAIARRNNSVTAGISNASFMYLTCNSNLGVESITLQQLHAGAFLFKLFKLWTPGLWEVWEVWGTAVEFRGSFESQPVIQDTEQAQLLQRSFWDSWDLRYLRPWQSDKMDLCMIYVWFMYDCWILMLYDSMNSMIPTNRSQKPWFGGCGPCLDLVWSELLSGIFGMIWVGIVGCWPAMAREWLITVARFCWCLRLRSLLLPKCQKPQWPNDSMCTSLPERRATDQILRRQRWFDHLKHLRDEAGRGWRRRCHALGCRDHAEFVQSQWQHFFDLFGLRCGQSCKNCWETGWESQNGWSNWWDMMSNWWATDEHCDW